jgi:cysteinyl-tRNA synthetase
LPDGADIHGGGADLRVPHHENELAQSAGAHPARTFVRAWAHHGMVTLASGKMAKSLGNILDVKSAVELHGSDALRMWFLQGHYSQPINYSKEILEEKKRSYERLRNLYARIAGSTSSSDLDENLVVELRERFNAAMQNDLNTPEAIAALFEAAGRAGQEIAARPQAAREFLSLKDAFTEFLTILGFELSVEKEFQLLGHAAGSNNATAALSVIRVRDTSEPEEKALEKIDRREQARREKNWALADQLRDELRAEGWIIEDTPEGPLLIRR